MQASGCWLQATGIREREGERERVVVHENQLLAGGFVKHVSGHSLQFSEFRL
jgi:hypothetical protein